jgi:hypothetical protein
LTWQTRQTGNRQTENPGITTQGIMRKMGDTRRGWRQSQRQVKQIRVWQYSLVCLSTQTTQVVFMTHWYTRRYIWMILIWANFLQQENIFVGVDTFFIRVNWKLETLEAFLKLKYIRSMHFQVCLLRNKRVIKLRAYICTPPSSERVTT